MKVAPLSASALRWSLPKGVLDFEHTGELEPSYDIIGHPRALEALEQAVQRARHVYVAGLGASDRLQVVDGILASFAPPRRTKRDFVALHNFDDPPSPTVLRLPAETADEFREDMRDLLGLIRVTLDPNRKAKGTPADRWKGRKERTGPLRDQLTPIWDELAKTHRRAARWMRRLADEVHALDGPLVPDRKKALDKLAPAFTVQILQRGSRSSRAPIVVLENPTMAEILGGIRPGNDAPPHLRVQAGRLHEADGGYLVLDAHRILGDAAAWGTLRRVLSVGEVRIMNADQLTRGGLAPVQPDSVPVDVVAVLVGASSVFGSMHASDSNFRRLFPIQAEFEEVVPYDDAIAEKIAAFAALTITQEGLPHLDRSGVEALVGRAVRESGRRSRIRLALDEMRDLVREAAYQANHETVTAADVDAALATRNAQRGGYERRTRDSMRRGYIRSDNRGSVVGQMNGLAVYRSQGNKFARPIRITANVGAGRGGFINIEREAGLSGRSHDKGIQVLAGFLRGRFGRHRTLAVTASICVEQNYGRIDGDSASAAELLALLSAIANVPIDQGIAITGSVDQHGNLQPIGSVNDKVEGFFAHCKAHRLTGTQGVIVPKQNAQDLMLSAEVVDACERGRFSVWPAANIDEALSLITPLKIGKPAARTWAKDSFYGHVTRNLADMEAVVRRAAKGAPRKST